MITATDYELVRERAGALDRGPCAALRFRGAEAAEFLQGQVSNDVEGLAPGTGCYATLLDHKGKLRADMRILRAPGWIWLDCDPAALEVVRKTVRVYSIGRDVRMEDVSGQYAIVSLLGPRSDDALDAVPGEREHDFVDGGHGLYVRTAAGVDVICAAGDAAGVRDALGVEPVGEEVAECLRVEAGRPRLGIDMTGDTMPQEAGINERAVSFTKGCYVGQETVARLHYKGKPNRMLRGLRLSAPAQTGTEVRAGERVVGRLGSSAFSPAHGPIALAILRREVCPGDTVAVGEATAEVVALPF